MQLDLTELTREQAYALAQLCKRIGYSDARSMSVDDAEARAMLVATDVLRAALADAGYAVR